MVQIHGATAFAGVCHLVLAGLIILNVKAVRPRRSSDTTVPCISQQKPHTARPKRDGGRWGVVPASQHQEIPVALASLIRAERCGMALDIIVEELQR